MIKQTILLQLYDGDVIQPMNGLGYSTYPCIYRQHIYFLSTPQAREEFSKNPMLYLTQNISRPVVPIRLSIVGPPKSGKTACKYLSLLKRNSDNNACTLSLSCRERCAILHVSMNLYKPPSFIQGYRSTVKNPTSPSLTLEP